MKRFFFARHGASRPVVAIIVALTMLGSAAIFLWPRWRTAQTAAVLNESLPTVPAQVAPKELAARLAQADAQVREKKDVVAAMEELARLYQANGYNDEAERCWRALERVEPNDAHCPYYLADLARSRSDYGVMGEALQRTVALAPDYAPAWLRLADWQLKTGETDAAFTSYNRRLTLVPKDPYARLGLARIALQKQDRATAGTLLAELVQDSPAFSTGHNLYAEYLAGTGDASGASRQRWMGRETGRFRDADDPWLNELTARCYDYQRLLVLGTLDYQTDHGDKGESFFRRAIQVQPYAFPAYEQLGTLYLKNHDAARAKEILEEGERRVTQASAENLASLGKKASAFTRPSPMYYVNLSQAYRDLKHLPEAVAVARKGLEKIGDNLELEDALGIALGAEGNYDEAIDALHRALAFNPNDSDSNYNLALCLQGQGREAEALEALHRSLVLQPTFPAALLILARREMELENLEEAEKYIHPLFDSHPEMKEVRDLALQWRLKKAKAAEDQKNYGEADKQYKAALAIDQNDPDLVSRLGVMHLISGEPQQALPWLQSYHKMRPDDARGALYLGQAYAMQGNFSDAKRVLSEGIDAAQRTHADATASHLREILGSLP
ncbi:MAG TPA: tetratricopeptide repeat protein [Opitutaceae bacterium]